MNEPQSSRASAAWRCRGKPHLAEAAQTNFRDAQPCFDAAALLRARVDQSFSARSAGNANVEYRGVAPQRSRQFGGASIDAYGPDIAQWSASSTRAMIFRARSPAQARAKSTVAPEPSTVHTGSPAAICVPRAIGRPPNPANPLACERQHRAGRRRFQPL